MGQLAMVDCAADASCADADKWTAPDHAPHSISAASLSRQRIRQRHSDRLVTHLKSDAGSIVAEDRPVPLGKGIARDPIIYRTQQAAHALNLIERKIPPAPLPYLSAFFEISRRDHYECLRAVSEDGA